MSAEIKVAASFGDTDVGTGSRLDFYVRCQGGLGPTRWKYIEGDTPFEEAAILAATLARRVQRLEGAHDTLMAVIETHKPTCSQCGQPWTEGKTVCGFDHLEIRAAIEARAALAEEAE